MKCQSCGKREATVRYTENINGKKQEMYFCMECAKKLGFANFSDLFSPLFSSIPDYFGDIGQKETIKCPKCNYTFEDYTNTGMFGCPECYETFKDRLDDIFIKLHGKNRHVKSIGTKVKVTKNTKQKSNNIEELKEKLRVLVEEEKYEEAAVIRDKIKKLEKINRRE